MLNINGVNVKKSELEKIFSKQIEKEKTKLNYNLFNFITYYLKVKNSFNVLDLINKSEKELKAIKNKIELPSLDRSLKDNLKFTNDGLGISKDFLNRIKIGL